MLTGYTLPSRSNLHF